MFFFVTFFTNIEQMCRSGLLPLHVAQHPWNGKTWRFARPGNGERCGGTVSRAGRRTAVPVPAASGGHHTRACPEDGIRRGSVRGFLPAEEDTPGHIIIIVCSRKTAFRQPETEILRSDRTVAGPRQKTAPGPLKERTRRKRQKASFSLCKMPTSFSEAGGTPVTSAAGEKGEDNDFC